MRKIRIFAHISLDGVISPGGGSDDYADGVLINSYRHIGPLQTESTVDATA